MKDLTLTQYNFRPVPYNHTDQPAWVSITKYGRVGLPRSFVRGHAITKGVRASLYWDETARVIGIAFAGPEDHEAFPVVLTRDGARSSTHNGSFGFTISPLRPTDASTHARHETGKPWTSLTKRKSFSFSSAETVLTNQDPYSKG